MTRSSAILISPMLLVLTACGANPDSGSNSAEDFAARINGGAENAPAATPVPTNTPTIAAPLPGAAQGAFAPGTATDPESSTCSANLMGDYIGKPADDATKSAIMIAAAGASEVRFVTPGGATVNPDPTNPRLNIMIDNLGIIRDARCG